MTPEQERREARRHDRTQHRARVLRDTSRRMLAEARNWTADMEVA
jgi:hypothetical protein